MATSTNRTFLMKKSNETYNKLVDIKDFPDLGGAPESLETTTLSDGVRTYIEGIQAIDPLEFTANYSATDYATLVALKGSENNFSVWFGGTEADGVVTPTGSAGKFNFSGYLSVYVTGAAVNEVVSMTITIIPSSAITKATS